MQDKPRPGRPPSGRTRGILIALLCASLAMAAGVFVFARLRALRDDPRLAFATPTPPAATPVESAAPAAPQQAPSRQLSITLQTPAPTPQPEQVLGANAINIVLMGLDSDAEREAAGKGWRSDTIAILAIDVKKPACTVINVPRDTRARVRKLSDAGKVIGKQYNKINSAFQYGGGPEALGHENLMYSLEELLFDGLRSEICLGYYASIDMDGVARFADAVGGVPLTLEYDIPGFGAAGEEILLEGENARKFVRLRHGITGGSDIGRIGRQQAFIRAFAGRVQALGAKEAVPRLWGALRQYVNTNLSAEQALVLGNLLSDIDLDSIEFITLPGACKTIDGKSYYVPDADAVRELAKELWG